MSKTYKQLRNQQNTQFKHKPRGMRRRRHYLWLARLKESHRVSIAQMIKNGPLYLNCGFSSITETLYRPIIPILAAKFPELTEQTSP